MAVPVPVLVALVALLGVEACGTGPAVPPPPPPPDPAAAPVVSLAQRVARIEDDAAVRRATGLALGELPGPAARLAWDDGRRALRKAAQGLAASLEAALGAAPTLENFDAAARLVIVAHVLSAHREVEGYWSPCLPGEELGLLQRLVGRSLAAEPAPDLFLPTWNDAPPGIDFDREGLARLAARGGSWSLIRRPEDWRRQGRNTPEIWRTNLQGVRFMPTLAGFGDLGNVARTQVTNNDETDIRDSLVLDLLPFEGDLELVVRSWDFNEYDRLSQMVLEVSDETARVHAPVVPDPFREVARLPAWAGGGKVGEIAHRIRLARAVLPPRPRQLTIRVRGLQPAGDMQPMARFGIIAQRTGAPAPEGGK